MDSKKSGIVNKLFILSLVQVLLSSARALSANPSRITQSNLPPHCKELNVDNKCKKCEAGYFLQEDVPNDGGVCNKCFKGCKLCTSINACQACISGYYFIRDEDDDTDKIKGICKPCHVNCKECTSPISCTRCEDGFVKQLDKCEACDSSCLTCEGVPAKCTSCSENYRLDTEGSCYYRYSIYIVLAICLGTVFVVFLFSKLVNCVADMTRAKRKGNTPRNKSESILGEEFRSDPSIIQEVSHIGRSTDLGKGSNLGGSALSKNIIEEEEPIADISNLDDSHINPDDLFDPKGSFIKK